MLTITQKINTKTMQNYSHQQLASIWIQYNGQKVTDKRLATAMKLTISQLESILKQRGLI